MAGVGFHGVQQRGSLQFLAEIVSCPKSRLRTCAYIRKDGGEESVVGKHGHALLSKDSLEPVSNGYRRERGYESAAASGGDAPGIGAHHQHFCLACERKGSLVLE